MIRFSVSSGHGKEKSRFFSLANLTTGKIVQADDCRKKKREREKERQTEYNEQYIRGRLII
jgi:hypothetical protein